MKKGIAEEKERLGFDVNRSSRLQMFFKKSILKNFANFHSLKTPVLESLFNKVAWPQALLKSCFLVKFTKSSRTCFFTCLSPLVAASVLLTLSFKLTSHGIMHYLWSADLSKNFSQLIVSIFIFSMCFYQLIVSIFLFSQYFFQ